MLFRSMKRINFLVLLISFVLVGTANGQKLASTIDELGIFSQELDGGGLKIQMSDDSGTTIILAFEDYLYGRDDLDFMKIITMYTMIVDSPDDYRPSAALLTKMAEDNGGSGGGTLWLNGNDVWYKSIQHYDVADANTIDLQVTLAHLNTQSYRPDYEAFVEEE